MLRGNGGKLKESSQSLKKGESRKITEKDFVVLCANCHRMIHRLEDSSDLIKLKSLIKK